MQTHGEKLLVEHLAQVLREGRAGPAGPRLLNVGAGRSVAIEDRLLECGVSFACDRIDVEDCAVAHPVVEHCWTGSVEAMSQTGSEVYTAVFANYVLEHVRNVAGAAREVHRVLRPGGRFVASLPNPCAPEFRISKRTPLWLHRTVRGKEAWETRYAYTSIRDLQEQFESAGFSTSHIAYYPAVGNYLSRFPVLAAMGRAYDTLVSALRRESLLGDVCIAFVKNPPGADGDAVDE